MTNLKQVFKKEFPEILVDEQLKNHCSFHIGGPADFFYNAKTRDEISRLIIFAKKNKIKFLVIGSGTNILFDDKGFRGLIIKIDLKNIKVDGLNITAEGGAQIFQLIKFSLENKLQGLEKWSGLPGTVGGAVRGNAGCNNLETKDILIKAKILNPKTGKIKTVDNKYFKFSYRNSRLKKSNEILLSATFKLEKSKISPENQQKLITEIQASRSNKIPRGLSAGSFFKNPSPQKPAGLLIEKAGLKGKTIGGAQVSEIHANFIINTGNATSSDIKKLAKLIQKTVKNKFKITLKPEVQIIE